MISDDDKQKLIELRDKVLGEVLPLAIDGSLEPYQRFTLLLAKAKMSGALVDFESAYETAKSIEDPQQKSESLLDLAEELDIASGELSFETEEDNNNAPNNSPTDQPVENSGENNAEQITEATEPEQAPNEVTSDGNGEQQS